jgi:hypothetical protein
MQTTTETGSATPAVPAVVKKDYEVAVDAFLAAEKVWKEAEEYVASGKFMADILVNANGNPSKAMTEWTSIWNSLRLAQEDYNAKRRSAADALRASVVLSPNQERGPNGDATMVTYGGFKASSVTKRTFDPDDLFRMVKQHGLQDRLFSLKKLDKDTGNEVPLVRQEWAIDYDGVMNWLSASKLDDVIKVAYSETESTPQVKGPKEVTFLGERK